MKLLSKPFALYRQGKLDEALEEYRRLALARPELKRVAYGWISLIERQIKSSISESRNQETKKAADIILPIFNARDDTIKCIESIQSSHCKADHTLIIVNDCSERDLTTELEQIAYKDQSITLIHNPENLGYTKSVNIGLRSGRHEVAVILNSDTIVSKGWIDKLIVHFQDLPDLAAVGALSNAASYQSIPAIVNEEGRFAVNELPNNISIEEINNYLEAHYAGEIEEVPLLNGFCYAVRRQIIDEIGYLDEIAFPRGYGEENDLCIRMTNNGYILGVACDTYVFHSKSKSFGSAQKEILSKSGREALDKKHGSKKIRHCVQLLTENQKLNHIRQSVKEDLYPKHITNGTERYYPSIVYFLPVRGGGGGAHSVIQEANHLMNLGVEVKVAIKSEHVETYKKAYPSYNLSELLLPVTPESTTADLSSFNVVIATIFQSASLVARIHEKKKDIMPAYYIQDYEPLFFPENDYSRQIALKSYTASDNFLCFAKTDWIREQVGKYHSVNVYKVRASLDHSVYTPTLSRTGPKTVSAMIRPQTPRRGAERTMMALKEIMEKTAASIEIFGCAKEDSFFEGYSFANKFIIHGHLKREEVAGILRRSDVFLDLSDYQAFGRTGIEAMASGCIPVLPLDGGAHEYGINGENCLFVDTKNWQDSIGTIVELLSNSTKMYELRVNALQTASRYSIHSAAVSVFSLVCHQYQKHINKFPPTSKQFLFLNVPEINQCPHGLLETVIFPNSASLNISTKSKSKLEKGASPNGFSFELSSEPIPSKISSAEYTYRYLSSPVDDHLYMIDSSMADYSCVQAEKSKNYTLNTLLMPKLDCEASDSKIKIIFDQDSWQTDITNSTRRKYYLGRDNIIRIGFMGCAKDRPNVDFIISLIHKALPVAMKYKCETIGIHQGVNSYPAERIALPRNRSLSGMRNWIKERMEWDFGFVYKPSFSSANEELIEIPAILYRVIQFSALGVPILIHEDCASFDFLKHGHNCLIIAKDLSNIGDFLHLYQDRSKTRDMAANLRQDIADNGIIASASTLLQCLMRQ